MSTNKLQAQKTKSLRSQASFGKNDMSIKKVNSIASSTRLRKQHS